MKFIVTRTSMRLDFEQPCAEAHQETVVSYDRRNADTPEKIPLSRGQSANWWYEHGRNHRVERKMIVRDFDENVWMVEFATLEELLAFSHEYGELIIGPWQNNLDYEHIEIYDDYRE
jgi:hypothetical protein